MSKGSETGSPCRLKHTRLDEVPPPADESEKKPKWSESSRRPHRGERRSSSAPEKRNIAKSLKKSSEASCSQEPKQTKHSKTSAWKTSKFFSRTLPSGELLRSLKKLSISSSGEDSEGKSAREHRKKRTGSEEIGMQTSIKCNAAEPGRKDSVQDEGIICKKQDLMDLINEASKRKPAGSSPLTKKCVLRKTRSASLESPRESRHFKFSLQRSGSEDCRYNRKANLFSDEGTKPSSPVVVDMVEVNVEPPNEETGLIIDNICDAEDMKDGSPSTVQWGDGDYVDAVLIGDAIESFLKDSMGSYCEKKVSFKKAVG